MVELKISNYMPGSPRSLFKTSLAIFGIFTVFLVMALLLVKPLMPAEYPAQLVLADTASGGYKCTGFVLPGNDGKTVTVAAESVFVYEAHGAAKSIRIKPSGVAGIAGKGIPVYCNCADISGAKITATQEGKLLQMEPSKQNLLLTLTGK